MILILWTLKSTHHDNNQALSKNCVIHSISYFVQILQISNNICVRVWPMYGYPAIAHFSPICPHKRHWQATSPSESLIPRILNWSFTFLSLIFSLRITAVVYLSTTQPFPSFSSIFFIFPLFFFFSQFVSIKKSFINFLPERLIMVFVKDIFVSFKQVVIYLRLFRLPVSESSELSSDGGPIMVFFLYFTKIVRQVGRTGRSWL